MSIKPHPRKTGHFIVRYVHTHPITRIRVDRKREAKTRKEAERLERELIVEVNDLMKKKTVPTWDQTVALCEKSSLERGLTKKTVYDSAVCVRAHTAEEWSARLVDSITTQEIRDVISSRVGHRKPSHQKYVMKCIRSIFTFAVEAGHVSRNPTPIMKFKIGDKIMGVLSETQAREMLTKAKELDWDWYPHYSLALYTGLRNGELYALKKSCVDFESNTILVNSSWNSKDGFKSTKSGDDRRTDIPSQVIPLLKELIADGSSEFLLPRLAQWDMGNQARDLRMFLKTLGLPEIRFHDLRATWATILLSKGVEPIKLLKMGGWKDLETLMIYARKSGVDIKGASNCMNLSPELAPKPHYKGLQLVTKGVEVGMSGS